MYLNCNISFWKTFHDLLNLFFAPLVCNSCRSVCNIYSAAPLKAAFLNLVLHDYVAFVGVYADVFIAAFAVSYGTVEYAVKLPVACDSMDGYIFIIIGPAAVFDIFVCGFLAFKKRKHTMWHFIVAYQMAGSPGDVLLNQLP